MPDTATTPLLDGITFPLDVRALPDSALVQLASELRADMVQSVSRTGGHLAPALALWSLQLRCITPLIRPMTA